MTTNTIKMALPKSEYRADCDACITGAVAGSASATTTEFVATSGPRRLLLGTVRIFGSCIRLTGLSQISHIMCSLDRYFK